MIVVFSDHTHFLFFIMYCFNLCSVFLSHGVMGKYEVCDCAVLWSYKLSLSINNHITHRDTKHEESLNSFSGKLFALESV